MVTHSVGFIPDFVGEIVTEYSEYGDAGNVIADVIGDIAKDVVAAVILDLVMDLSLRPIPPGAVSSGKLGEVLKERVARAKQVTEMATRQGAAPSSRELALVRRVLMKHRERK